MTGSSGTSSSNIPIYSHILIGPRRFLQSRLIDATSTNAQQDVGVSHPYCHNLSNSSAAQLVYSSHYVRQYVFLDPI